MVADTDMGKVGRVGADTNEWWGALLAMGAASALDERTASIKPASRAEWATAAKSKALEPAAYGKPGRRCKMP